MSSSLARALATVLLLGASAVASAGEVPATLTWPPVPGATTYELEIASDRAFKDVLHRATPSAPRYGWTTSEGVVSYLRIRALGAKGKRFPWSPVRTVEVRLDPPEPSFPPPGAEHLLGGKPLELEARASRFVTLWRFQLSKTPSFSQVVAEEKSTYRRVRMEKALAGSWYWRVGGKDGFGNDLPFSDPVSLSVLPRGGAAAPIADRAPDPPPAPPIAIEPAPRPPIAPTPPKARPALAAAPLPTSAPIAPSPEPERTAPPPTPPAAPSPAPRPAPARPPVSDPPRAPAAALPELEEPPPQPPVSILVAAGWRSGAELAGPAAAIAADYFPAALGGGFGLRLHFDTWSASATTALGSQPDFLGFSAQAGFVGRTRLGPVQLSGGFTAGALHGLPSDRALPAGSPEPVGQLFGDVGLVLGRHRLGLELSIPAGRWSVPGLEVRLGGAAALLAWSLTL
jgi:hypothetical protein